MRSFDSFSSLFTERFNTDHFPNHSSTLYEPNRYFLKLGGKRVRPVLCLMANELFNEVTEDAWLVASAIELFHNFTLIHDDIMDKAPMRRGMETVHEKFGESTALLAGDVMLVTCYEYLRKTRLSSSLIGLFNRTAMEVCEGQQLDMDFEKKAKVSLEEYVEMINKKTSVLLAASLQMGAMLGGALERNQKLLYEFGRKMGLAFQVQDDYLDAFGDPKKFGKQIGGDIRSNKKTFLLIHAQEVLDASSNDRLNELMLEQGENKVAEVISLYKKAGVDEWARTLKQQFSDEALKHLDDVAVVSNRKEHLYKLAHDLLRRQN